jgi:enoyl-CoA hydratase/carnithine racemase
VFGLPEVGLGILPGAGGTQTLPRIVGLSGSLDMLLTGRRLTAVEARDVGLVNRVVPKERLYGVVDETATRIASFDVQAVRNAKQAVTRGMDMTLEQGLDLEKKLAVRGKGFIKK